MSLLSRNVTQHSLGGFHSNANPASSISNLLMIPNGADIPKLPLRLCLMPLAP